MKLAERWTGRRSTFINGLTTAVTDERKRAAYWACGLGVLVSWPGGAVLGAVGLPERSQYDAIGEEA